MNRLRYVLETFNQMLSEGRGHAPTLKLQSTPEFHTLSFDESTFPEPRSAAFKAFEFKVKPVEGEAPAKTLLREMVTAPESVYKVSKLFSTYNLHRHVGLMFEDIKEVQHLHKGKLDLFDAFTKDGGLDIEAYFVRPECADRHPDLFAKAQISPTQDTVDKLSALGMYRKVALIPSLSAVAPEDVTEHVFSTLQNEQLSWKDNTDIITMTDFPRSMGVGDVLLFGSHAHLVKGSGFEQLTGFWPREPEKEVARYDWGSDGPSL
ncbi:hypothetical protein V0M98_36520 (plasmid) [Pseudomonas silesiensis]|uniref:hypothetical protein n=1 Tax=Pseudomonas silesiensis TaxID=1853130 RepID=UPI0030D4FB5C